MCLWNLKIAILRLERFYSFFEYVSLCGWSQETLCVLMCSRAEIWIFCRVLFWKSLDLSLSLSLLCVFGILWKIDKDIINQKKLIFWITLYRVDTIFLGFFLCCAGGRIPEWSHWPSFFLCCISLRFLSISNPIDSKT